MVCIRLKYCVCIIITLIVIISHGNVYITAYESSSDERSTTTNHIYSSHQCIGGSQVLETKSMKWAMRQGQGEFTLNRYPLNEAEFRTCLYRNICLIGGTLTYYISNNTKVNTPNDYLPDGFDGKMIHTGHLRRSTLPIQTVVSNAGIPKEYQYHSVKNVFLDANSWTFNYGHYLNDNVLPAYFAARIFNIEFNSIQQLFETNCRLFETLPANFADRLVDYNRSMGTYRQACLNKLDGMYHYFFEHTPIYVDLLSTTNVCFKQLVGGHGSTFGLKSVENTRGIIVRELRDYILNNKLPKDLLNSKQEDLILVGLRTVGTAGGAVIPDLCNTVTNALQQLPLYKDKYRIECFVPSHLSFEDEVKMVRRAKILVSVHGTISYMSLFTRDGTQYVSIADPKEFKENQTLLYLTHLYLLYITWDRLESLKYVLERSIENSLAYFSSI